MARTKKTLTSRQKKGKSISRQRAARKFVQKTSRRLVLLSVAACLLGVTGGGWWFWQSGRLGQTLQNASERAWAQTAELGFKTENIYIEGRTFTSLADVVAALDVKAGAPILALSPSQMRARLEDIPRVKYAEVARVLPGDLHVRLVEREPAAIWQSQGKLRLIDLDGTVMEYAAMKQFSHLPVVVGEDAPQNTRALFSMLAGQPELFSQVASAVRVGERRWNLRFRSGVELKLPEDEPAKAWDAFADMEKEHHLLARAVQSVDMRLGDRAFIKTDAKEAKAKAPLGKEAL